MRFLVRAIGPEGYTMLQLEAASAELVRSELTARGYTVLSLRRRGWLPRRGSRFPLMLFNQELVTLLGAGLGLIESLQALREKHHAATSRAVLDGVLRALHDGRTFASALAEAGSVFPRLYVETVRAAERTGSLVEAIERFVAYQAQVEKVRRKLLSASIYPLLLVIVGSGVALFMLGYVVPRFAAIYGDLGRDLPLLSALLLAFGRFVGAHYVWIAAGAAIAGGATYGLLMKPQVQAALRRGMESVPRLGEQLQGFQLARLYRAIGMLLQGGIAFPRAADMVGGLLSEAMARRLGGAVSDVRDGRSISDAMQRHGLVTPVALRMLAVGERSGNMGEMMEKAAAFFDEEFERWVDWFVRLFEPLLMMFIGLVIGVIVLLMYMPIFDLAGSLQ